MAELLVLLVCLPLGFAAIALAAPSNRWRPWVLPLGSLTHLLLTLRALPMIPSTDLDEWLKLDPLGKIFLLLISVLFFLCACYAPGYLAHRQHRDNRVLCACLMVL